jgi:hypothetical protein
MPRRTDPMAELGVHRSALLTDLALCVNRYRLFSPGWYVCVLAKVQLSAEESEVPGLVAMVNYGRKKQCEVRDEVFKDRRISCSTYLTPKPILTSFAGGSGFASTASTNTWSL